MSTPNHNIYFYLRKSRPDRDGKYPIYIRISINNDRMEYPSGQSIHTGHWDDKKQKAIRAKEAGAVNGVLTTAKADINKAVSQLQISQTEVTLESVRLLVKGEAVKDTPTFIIVAHEHNDSFEKQIGKKYSQGSYKNYKTTLKYLIEFIPIYCGKKDIPTKPLLFLNNKTILGEVK